MNNRWPPTDYLSLTRSSSARGVYQCILDMMV